MSASHLRLRNAAPYDQRIEQVANLLAAAVDAKAGYHPSHCRAVERYSLAIGARLGVRGIELARLGLAGLLHDVGKLAVPDEILRKPDKPTPSEWAVLQQHPVRGHDVLRALGLVDEARWVLHHHERGDGNGYPTGLAGDAIPFGSRIILVADAFDVMTTRRVYQAARSREEALSEMRANPDQFDQAIVDSLADMLSTQPRSLLPCS